MKTRQIHYLCLLLATGFFLTLAGCARSNGGPVDFMIRETRPYIMAGEPAGESGADAAEVTSSQTPDTERL